MLLYGSILKKNMLSDISKTQKDKKLTRNSKFIELESRLEVMGWSIRKEGKKNIFKYMCICQNLEPVAEAIPLTKKETNSLTTASTFLPYLNSGGAIKSTNRKPQLTRSFS